MKTLAALVLCVLCMCASAYEINMGPSTNSLSKVRENFRNHKRKIVANRSLLTDEEKEAKRRKSEESRRIDRTKKRKAKLESITAKFSAAKAACPDCYRVICTNGVYVAFTREQFEAYERKKAEASKSEHEAMEAHKHRKHMPGNRLRRGESLNRHRHLH